MSVQYKYNARQMGILLSMITLFSFWFVWKQYIYFSINSVALAIYSVLSVCWWPDPGLPHSSVGFEWSLWLRKQKHLHAPRFLKAQNWFCYQSDVSAGLSHTCLCQCVCLCCNRQQKCEPCGGHNKTVNTCCTFLTCKITSYHSFWNYLLFFFFLLLL